MSRNAACYICGKAIVRGCLIVAIQLDGRSRNVHSKCKIRYEKAEIDLQQKE